MTPADSVTRARLRPTDSRATIGAVSRHTPTTARTRPSVISGKYSRRTCVVGSAVPTASLSTTSSMPAVAVRRPPSAVAKSGDGGAMIPRPGLVRGEHAAVGQADLDPQDLTLLDQVGEAFVEAGLALGRRSVRPEIVRRERVLDTKSRTIAASAPTTVELSVVAEKSADTRTVCATAAVGRR